MVNIAWFKRDLRVADNAALSSAVNCGDVLPLYIFEPELWQQPDMSRRHYDFLKECLISLRADLKVLGLTLVIKTGDTLDILQSIHERYTVKSIWSHQETWNGWTYQRDIRVKKWTLVNNIQWNEPAQNGVVRNIRTRNGWSANWNKEMRKPFSILNPITGVVGEGSDNIPSPEQLRLSDDCCRNRQSGGRLEAQTLLKTFLYQRGKEYSKEMSSPVTAFDSCSRLSPHLAFGTISVREAFSATEKRIHELKSISPEERGNWMRASRSFAGRLRWHCHFIQKLEDQPSIEFDNMHPLYDGLRENDFNEEYFEAWREGRTGYPMIDACMRALKETGWINFRMRAMLMSFSSYHLWLHWRRPALYLAKLFTDYEPGIHYSQVQMQSGTTGINSIRIYNPIKQGLDHDPKGDFIRKWIPELGATSNELIHKPIIENSRSHDYPCPIVNENSARKTAAGKIYNLRRTACHKEQAKTIFIKHGSRKSPSIRRQKGTKTNHAQGELSFDMSIKKTIPAKGNGKYTSKHDILENDAVGNITTNE